MMEKYQDTRLPYTARANDLVSRMTTAEKMSQLQHESPAIGRLGIPAYNWWSEALHGMARNGTATVFPVPLALAATFDEEFVRTLADAVSDEVRGRWNDLRTYLESGEADAAEMLYMGLSECAPNINLFRDPRWGRGQETYGEDPYLTSRMGIAYIRGLQGDDARHHKVDACIKHFIVHSGPESLRHEMDVKIDEKSFREYYLPAFAACIREADVASVMGAYNRVNSEPCSGSAKLIKKLLRTELDFRGYFVSDAGAINDFHAHHKTTANAVQSAGMALSAGCDLNIGDTYKNLPEALRTGLISESDVDRAVKLLYEARVRLGMFDPKGQGKFDKLNGSLVCCEKHTELAREAARRSFVLLKNRDSLLPLRIGTKLAVIGPNADSRELLLGNYEGTPKTYTTLLRGILDAAGEDNVIYAQGCGYVKPHGKYEYDPLPEAILAAKKSDVVVLCLGNTAKLEGEEGDGGDRESIELPEVQKELLRTVAAVGKPIVLVLGNGGPVTLTHEEDLCTAILEVWYPGQAGGEILGEVLFGDTNPSGRMPVSVVRDIKDLPAFEDYTLEGRTYRYAEAPMEFPFGFGLSYTRFEYSNLIVSPVLAVGKDIEMRVTVENAGDYDGEAVVEVYVGHRSEKVIGPMYALAGFRRVALGAGESETIDLKIPARQLATIGQDGSAVIEPGAYQIYVGGVGPDAVSAERGGDGVLTAVVTLTGSAQPIAY
jgi:beta-glucosidase